jgi:hypothetical protein
MRIISTLSLFLLSTVASAELQMVKNLPWQDSAVGGGGGSGSPTYTPEEARDLWGQYLVDNGITSESNLATYDWAGSILIFDGPTTLPAAPFPVDSSNPRTSRMTINGNGGAIENLSSLNTAVAHSSGDIYIRTVGLVESEIWDLSDVSQTGTLLYFEDAAFTNVNGLSGTSLEGGVQILSSSASTLTDISGLSGLTSTKIASTWTNVGDVVIDKATLKDISGLSNFTTAGSNFKLIDISGMEHLDPLPLSRALAVNFR